MTGRLKTGALAGLLVLTLILVGFSLRSRAPEASARQSPGSSVTATASPSTVVNTGGGNDFGLPAEAFAQAVTETIAGLKKAVPEATMYVVNPWWDLRPVPESLAVQAGAVKRAASEANAVYLDTKQPLVDVSEPMVASGTNPNDKGHAALAKAVTEAIAQSD